MGATLRGLTIPANLLQPCRSYGSTRLGRPANTTKPPDPSPNPVGAPPVALFWRQCGNLGAPFLPPLFGGRAGPQKSPSANCTRNLLWVSLCQTSWVAHIYPMLGYVGFQLLGAPPLSSVFGDKGETGCSHSHNVRPGETLRHARRYYTYVNDYVSFYVFALTTIADLWESSSLARRGGRGICFSFRVILSGGGQRQSRKACPSLPKGTPFVPNTLELSHSSEVCHPSPAEAGGGSALLSVSS